MKVFASKVVMNFYLPWNLNLQPVYISVLGDG
jgi:hypothetical protein